MDIQEIPLLRESSVFSRRLISAVSNHPSSRYYWLRRINWSHRFDTQFYKREADYFLADPRKYLDGHAPPPSKLDDIYLSKLTTTQIFRVLVKVITHWAFRLLGKLTSSPAHSNNLLIYRKAYVDDIELVFDPGQNGVLRAIYPFPLSARRQLKYIKFIINSKKSFKITGNPYLPSDVLALLLRRTVRSLMNLESRSQILHAREIFALGVHLVQLSDEFDIGSLDLSRALRRMGIKVVNSAHGIGKYLPVHAYAEFSILTRRQQEYYYPAFKCKYEIRSLNHDFKAINIDLEAIKYAKEKSIKLIFLSQVFDGIASIVSEAEDRTLKLLSDNYSSNYNISLIYKPHPNSNNLKLKSGFKLADTIDLINEADRIFISFFSTCQIDPAFTGTKILVRTDLIFPEISFDDSETIISEKKLTGYLERFIAEEKMKID